MAQTKEMPVDARAPEVLGSTPGTRIIFFHPSTRKFNELEKGFACN